MKFKHSLYYHIIPCFFNDSPYSNPKITKLWSSAVQQNFRDNENIPSLCCSIVERLLNIWNVVNDVTGEITFDFNFNSFNFK